MSNEYESLPNTKPRRRKTSFSNSKLNTSNHDNNNLNVSSDCDSIISYKDDGTLDKKAFFDKIYKTKHGDSRSILSIAKDLNSNIQVNCFTILKLFKNLFNFYRIVKC